jgi:flagellar assembly protein FliH
LSRPDLPFEPFTVPHVAPSTPAPPTPVSWFQHIAPHLSPAKPPIEPDEVSVGVEAGTTGARKVAFADVEAIADAARRRRQMGEPEPPEIVLMRQQAAQEAQETIAQAKVQAQTIEQEARESGYQAGYAQGYADGEREATRHLTQRANDERTAYREDLTTFIVHIEAERQRTWAEMEPQMVGIIFDLAKQVIKQEIEASRTVALSLVRNSLRRVAESGTLRIRVHADDLATVRANREDLLSLVDGIPHIEIIEDRRVGPGGCLVETDAGNIDARIETQLEEVSSTLEAMTAHREGQG